MMRKIFQGKFPNAVFIAYPADALNSMGHSVCTHVLMCTDLLVVKNPSGSLALKLLLLQDALKVLHALVRVFHVSRQVAVEEADAVTKH